MSKQLGEDVIQNELEQSAFFKPQQSVPATLPSPETTTERTPARSTEGSSVRTNSPTPERPNGRTGVRLPARRIRRRGSFEFFQDQLQQLKEFSLEEELQGSEGSMSVMVREAIDDYIAKRRGEHQNPEQIESIKNQARVGR